MGYTCNWRRTSFRCKIFSTFIFLTFGYLAYLVYTSGVDIFHPDNLYLLSHPENWEWGSDVSKDLTVQDAIFATVYALKLWARLGLPWLAFGLRFLVEFSKENPSFPYIILSMIIASFVFFSLQQFVFFELF